MINWNRIINSKLATVAKIIISAMLLMYLIYNIDLESVKTLFLRFTLVKTGLLILIVIVRNWIGGIRFTILIQNQCSIPVVKTTAHYFIASFFNNFLPTAIGGDVMRVFLVSEEGMTKGKASLYILTERLIGFYALAVISAFSSLFWDCPDVVRLVIWGIFSSYSLVLILLYFFGRIQEIRFKFLQKIVKAMLEISEQPRILLYTFLMSILYQGISVFLTIFIALALLGSTNYIAFLTLIPLTWFITMIPISLGGVGVREMSFVALLETIHISNSEAFTLSIGTYAALLISAIMGGFLYLIYLRNKNQSKKTAYELNNEK